MKTATLFALLTLRAAFVQAAALPLTNLYMGPAVLEAPSVPAVKGAAVLRVTAAVKIFPLCDLDRLPNHMEHSFELLRQRYGFVRDQSFEPQALADKEQFTILPYPAEPRAMVYQVKGFLPESRLPEFSQDRMVKNVVNDDRPEPAIGAEFYVRFLQQFGSVIAAVPGVAAVAVGADCGLKSEHQHVMPHKAALVITLDGSAPLEDVERRLLAAVPPLKGLAHRYEAPASPAAPADKRFRTQNGW